MSQACPINYHNVDGTLFRITSFFTALFVVLFLATSQLLIIYFLVIDFWMRLFGCKQYSWVIWLASGVQKMFKLPAKKTDGAAKRLAGIFGFFFMIALMVESYFQTQILIFITAGIFLTCSSLEVFFEYCIGCEIYFFIKKIYPSFME